MLKPVCAPSSRASASIWTTSSRVGAMISTRGAVAPERAGAGWRRQRVNAAIRNAAVLPVPVWDWPATSLPRRARGSAASWVGVPATTPASSIPRRTGSGRSSAANARGLIVPGPRGAPARAASFARVLGEPGPRLLTSADAPRDDAQLVEDAERAGHERLVHDVGRRRQDRRDDEVDQHRVL